MPKMPDKSQLGAPASLRSGRQIIQAGDVDAGAIGRGLEKAGAGLQAGADSMRRGYEKEQRENDALDLIKADAAQRQALFDTERQFDEDGDYSTHDKRYTPMATQATDRAADLIRDPKRREMWREKANVDILAGRERLGKRASEFGKQERMVQLDTTLDGLRANFTNPKASPEEREQILEQTKTAIELGKRSGLLNPIAAAKMEELYVRGAVKQEAERRLLDDPEGLRRELLGKDVPLPLDDMANPETRAKPIGDKAAVPSGPAAGAGREESGRFMVDGLPIKDRIDPKAQYGKSASAKAQPFDGIVLHHTGGEGADKFIDYGHSVDKERGGSFGYHFYIDKDGTISQGAPMDARTNHVKPPTAGERKDRTGLSNENAIGISLVGSGGDETPQQLAAAKQLAASLKQTYGFDDKRIVGHGDLQNDRESREGQAALKAIRGEIRADDYLPASGKYAALTPLERAEFVKKSESGIRSRLDGQREQLKRSLDDDVESIRRTGQSTEVDLTTAKSVLEPNQLNRYFLERQEAQMEHDAVSDLPTLGTGQVLARVKSLEPKPGQANFDMRAKVYDKARKQAGDLIEARDVDPARSVESLPQVKEAGDAATADPTPENIQALARARMDAQAQVGISEARRSPITKAEAKVLMAPIRGLEGKSLTDAMQTVIGTLEDHYGPYANAAGVAATEEIVQNRDIAEKVHGQLKRAFDGLPPSFALARQLDYLNESGQAERAFAGFGSGTYAKSSGDFSKAYGDYLGADAPGMPMQGDPFSNYGLTKPSQTAINALKGNPALADQFNQKFGQGAAEQLLAEPPPPPES